MKLRKKVVFGFMMIVGFASCKHEYDCQCVWINNSKITSVNHTIGNMKVGDAQYYCDQILAEGYRGMASGQATDTIINCELKKLN